MKLAFVSFRSDRDQENEDAINNIIDANRKHEPLKKAIAELNDPPPGGIEVHDVRGDIIVLDVSHGYPIPYLQIINDFSQNIGFSPYPYYLGNPGNIMSFFVPTDEEDSDNPHRFTIFHNVLVLSYY